MARFLRESQKRRWVHALVLAAVLQVPAAHAATVEPPGPGSDIQATAATSAVVVEPSAALGASKADGALWLFLAPLATVVIGRFLRLRDVLRVTGFSRAQVYRLIERGEFPRQIPLTAEGRSVGWSEADVAAWQEGRIAAARGSGSRSGAAR